MFLTLKILLFKASENIHCLGYVDIFDKLGVITGISYVFFKRNCQPLEMYKEKRRN